MSPVTRGTFRTYHVFECDDNWVTVSLYLWGVFSGQDNNCDLTEETGENM